MTWPGVKVAALEAAVDALQKQLVEAADIVVERTAVAEGERIAVERPDRRRRATTMAKVCDRIDSMFFARTRPP